MLQDLHLGIKLSFERRYRSGRIMLPDLHHANTLTVGTNPCWSITDTPFIFFEAIFADHKSTGTTPAKLLLLVATMANIRSDLSFSISLFFLFHGHDITSP
jgi:hypothetical protein